MNENEMGVHPDYLPRLTLDLRHDQVIALRELLPHGMKKRVFSFIIDDLIEILRGDYVQLFLGGMATRDIKLDNWVKVPKVVFRKAVEGVTK